MPWHPQTQREGRQRQRQPPRQQGHGKVLLFLSCGHCSGLLNSSLMPPKYPSLLPLVDIQHYSIPLSASILRHPPQQTFNSGSPLFLLLNLDWRKPSKVCNISTVATWNNTGKTKTATNLSVYPPALLPEAVLLLWLPNCSPWFHFFSTSSWQLP
jgi:hypothetical protein